MKQQPMTKRKGEQGGKPDGKEFRRKSARGGVPDSAFDLWLNDGLHRLFDEVVREPIPDELLNLIEGHRGK